MGRSVRGEKDYSVIIVLGEDLVRFIKSKETNKYLSQQLRRQIEIAEEIANKSQSKSDIDKSYSAQTKQLIWQCLHRDKNWKEYYKIKMNCMRDENINYFRLDKFKNSIRLFIKKLKEIELGTISADKLQKLIVECELQFKDFISKYFGNI